MGNGRLFRTILGAALMSGAVATLTIGSAAGQATLAGWPMAGHDAGLSSRSTATSAQRPVLALGWPRPGFPYAANLGKQLLTAPVHPLIAPAGTIVLAGGPTTAIANPNGTIQKVLPIGPIAAIDTAGNLLGFVNDGDGVASYTPQGRLRWTAPISGHSAADRELLVAPNGDIYALTSGWSVTVIGPSGHVLSNATALNLPGGNPTSMAVAPDGTLYVGVAPYSSPNSRLLYALHPDGSSAWPSPATLPGGIVRIAVAPDGSLRVVDDAGHLSAVSTTGRLVWSVPVLAGTAIAVAANGTTIANVSLSKTPPVVHAAEAISADGAILWRYRATFGTPIIGGDGTIYLGGAVMMALRPNGTRLWQVATGTGLTPEAIGADGTLYAGEGGPGAPLVAVASPSGRAGSVVPNWVRLPHLISPLSMTVRFRTHGAAVTCPTLGRPCSPTTSLDSLVSFTLRDPATVLFTVRRSGVGRSVAHTVQRLQPGTTWEELIGGIYPDSASIFPRSLTARGGPLRPGQYTITVRASAGQSVVQTRPVSFVVVN